MKTALRPPRVSLWNQPIRPKFVSPSGQPVYGWKCRVPGDFSDALVPMYQVSAASEREYMGADFDRFETTIFYKSNRGEQCARRIALELCETGVAVLYPSDRDVVIYPGERHHIDVIGKYKVKP